MNRNGTHVGRPPYTPEQRMEASKRQFEEGLTELGPLRGNHWHQSRSYFLIPDGRKVRKAKFSMMLAFPDIEFGPDDRIYVKCPDKDCVNPKHLTVIDMSVVKAPIEPITSVREERELLELHLTTKDRHAGQTAWVRIRQHWIDTPIDENHPDVEQRMIFVPDPLPDDPEALRALLAEFGIITAA